jgi:hypothetical protein
MLITIYVRAPRLCEVVLRNLESPDGYLRDGLYGPTTLHTPFSHTAPAPQPA